MKKLYSLLAVCLLAGTLCAQQYYPSPLWGEQGHREYAPWSGSARAVDGLLRPDGKLLVAGTGYWNQCNCFRVTMALVDTTCGAPDPSFGNNGLLSFQFEGRTICHDILLQDDGKIVGCGVTAPGNGFSGHKPSVYRLLPNGEPDSTFNGNGTRKESFDAISSGAFWQAFVLPNGRIACVGSSSANINGGVNTIGAMRFNADGTMDNTFSGDGKVNLNVATEGYTHDYDLGTGVLLDDGSMVGIGLFTTGGTQYVGLFKIDSTGTFDANFGTNGLNVSPIVAASDVDAGGMNAAVTAGGKILVSGTSNFTNGEFFMARFNSNGNVDSTYATNGVSIVPIATAALGRRMELLDDGSTLQFGSQNWNNGHTRIIKRMEDGSLDISFGTNGIAAFADPTYVKTFGGLTLPSGRIMAWGLAGQISIFRFTTTPSAESIIELDDDHIGCGDSTLLDAGAGFVSYVWSTSDSTQTIYAYNDGNYIVEVVDADECADSDTIVVTMAALPVQPIITSGDGILLETTATGDLQWYLDGNAITGAIGPSHSAIANGNYTVEVTDINGCSNISDPFQVVSVGIAEANRPAWTIAPNPVLDHILLVGPSIDRPMALSIRSIDGRTILQQTINSNRVDLDRLPTGVFLLELSRKDQHYLMRFVKH